MKTRNFAEYAILSTYLNGTAVIIKIIKKIKKKRENGIVTRHHDPSYFPSLLALFSSIDVPMERKPLPPSRLSRFDCLISPRAGKDRLFQAGVPIPLEIGGATR